MSFNQPIVNEMLARETIEYRARDLEQSRRRRIALASRTSKKPPRRRSAFGRLRQTVRKPA